MKKIFALLIFSTFQIFLFGQKFASSGGGQYIFQHTECISEELREQEWQRILGNIAMLKAEGKLPEVEDRAPVKFGWVLGKNAGSGLTDPGYDAISNYLDRNANFPNQIQDYNCGTRSYDTNTGYTHLGTDLFTWPFAWYKVNNDQVKVIAGAAGTIIGKIDGNPHTSCSFCTNCNWNAVYIQHSDGSVAWYGHMKNGSLTTKAVGAAVAKGEYLGIVASSGNSTGPHLHFEVWANTNYGNPANLIDPWNGPCNSAASRWISQQAYRKTTINKVMTNSAPPVFPSCPSEEILNLKKTFARGSLAYFSSYFRDEVAGQVFTYRLLKPDGTTHQQWTRTASNTYSASWWWYSLTIPGNAPTGNWKFQVQFGNKTVSVAFKVTATLVNDQLDDREEEMPENEVIEEVVEPTVQILPNPFDEMLQVVSNAPIGQIAVVNSLGQQVKMLVGEADEAVWIPTQELNSGVYFVYVFGEKGEIIKIQKMLKN